MSHVASEPLEGLFSWINEHGDHSPQALSQWVLLNRYARGDERNLLDVQRRVVLAVSGAETEGARRRWRNRFLSAQMRGFLPAGRILAGCGVRPAQSLLSCFVQPMPAAPPFVDGLSCGVESALTEALITLGMGGGVGYDFSPVMPRLLGRSGAQTGPDGVVDTIRYLDETCQHMADGRGGGQMAVLRCDHPDIEEFIQAKRAGGLSNFTLAVGVTDAFMHAVLNGQRMPLVHQASFVCLRRDARRPAPDGSWGDIEAVQLWRCLLASAADVGEPSMLFLDHINADNNLSYCEDIRATNPRGEQPLPPHGACCQGVIDLSRCIRHPFTSRAEWDFALLAELVPIAVRMLDDVLDVTPWPLESQRTEALSKRRIGLGVTGLADALAMKGMRYGSEEARGDAAAMLECIRNLAYATSCELAIEKGAFPELDRELYLREPHAASRLPDSIKEKIRRTGIRNSHLLALAPAGSISVACADNASPGIEAPTYFSATQRLQEADGHIHPCPATNHALRLLDSAWGVNKPEHVAIMALASEITPEDQLAMLLALTPLVDGGISKTLLLPDDCSIDRVEQLCWRAWQGGVKGLRLASRGH